MLLNNDTKLRNKLTHTNKQQRLTHKITHL